MGWRGFYISKHYDTMVKASIIVEFVKQRWSSESIEGRYYLTAIQDLCSMQLGLKDVEMFFLKPHVNVLLNLVGLHYCISWLGVPGEHMMEILGYSVNIRKASMYKMVEARAVVNGVPYEGRSAFLPCFTVALFTRYCDSKYLLLSRHSVPGPVRLPDLQPIQDIVQCKHPLLYVFNDVKEAAYNGE